MTDDEEFVRSLLREQHPDLAARELSAVEGGWDNRQWRLGQDLAIRLPRTERAPMLLERELAWLPGLAAELPLPVPVPVRRGRPSSRFAHVWTIARWVDGDPADRRPITSTSSAELLGRFLRALHRPAPARAPENPPRGLPLSSVPVPSASLALLEDERLADAVRAVWACGVEAPEWEGPRLWLHGDLHPANVVTRDGELAGVLDFGDLCAGDPAWDLSAAWLLLPAGADDRFAEAYGADEASLRRARGWAVQRALALVEIGRNGRLGLPGGKAHWEAIGLAALKRAIAA